MKNFINLNYKKRFSLYENITLDQMLRNFLMMIRLIIKLIIYTLLVHIH